MQGNPPTNILRNSYGYQLTDPPQMRSPTNKPFLVPGHYPPSNQGESNAVSLKQLENKLEGLAIKKPSQPESNYQSQPMLRDGFDSRFRGQHPFGNEDQLSEQLLRGSCQNIMRKFDYNTLRNTTHFNPLGKPPTTHNELRRSPGA